MMSRVSILFILLLLIVIGGIVALASIDTQVPQTRVEKPVTNDATAG
jgi:hypothetical protein